MGAPQRTPKTKKTFEKPKNQKKNKDFDEMAAAFGFLVFLRFFWFLLVFLSFFLFFCWFYWFSLGFVGFYCFPYSFWLSSFRHLPKEAP